MTGCAVAAERAAVDIVFPVAGITGVRNFSGFLITLGMTLIAAGIRMLAGQGKIGLDGVIEFPVPPARRVVAGLARLAEPPIMLIILAVT